MAGKLPGIVLVLLVALPAAIPFLSEGILPTDDGAFHLFRLAALDGSLHSGVVFPRWFPDFAFGYGYPVLDFYSPASYYAAELPHLFGAGYVLSTKLMAFAAVALSGLFMYLWAAGIFGRTSAFLAAVAYVYFPYHLADSFVRGAFPEAAAFALFPAILWTLHRAFNASRPLAWCTASAGATALLILTHNLSALMFAPVLGGYFLLLAWLARSRTKLLLAVPFLALSLGLSAFFWLPAAAEMKWVQIGQELATATGYTGHLYTLADYVSPFNVYRYSPEQGTVAEHPFGRIQLLLALVSVAGLPFVLKRSREAFCHAVFFLIAGSMAVFMLLSISAGVWSAVPLLPALQYPWRLEALVALATSFLACILPYALDRAGIDAMGRGPAAGARFALAALWRSPALPGLAVVLLAGTVVVSGVLNLPRGRDVMVERDLSVQRMWSDDAASNQIGATWTAEFLPVFVKEERWRIPRSGPAGETGLTGSSTPPRIELRRADGWQWSFAVEAPQATRLSLHSFYFPGWEATVNGRPAAVEPAGRLGLVSFEVPAGRSEVGVQFGSTASRDVATLISLASAGVLALLLAARLPRRASFALLFAVAAATGLAVIHFLPGRPSTFKPVDANLQNVARLVGVETDRPSYRPGETMPVKLYWLGWETKGKDYKVFVHLSPGPGAAPAAQHDGDAGGGYTPTSRWTAGELLVDEHQVALPITLSAGAYRLEAGMYDPATVQNLGIVGDDGRQTGDRVLLREITVAAR